MSSAWTEEERQLFVQLWNAGVPRQDISKQLGKSVNSIKMYLQRHREELGLNPRINTKDRAKSQRPEFDRQWYGKVPFGHWTITKPWSKAS